jgi:hypothetical protein
MVSNEVQGIGGNLFVSHQTLRRLAVVRELKKMKHIGVLLLQYGVPRIVGDPGKRAADCLVPHLPVGARKNRVGGWDRTELELRIGREGLGRQDLVGCSLLVWIILPLDEAVWIPSVIDWMMLIVSEYDPPGPTLTLLLEELVAVTDALNSSLIFCKITEDLRGKHFGHGFRHIKNWEFGPRKALLNFPLIGSVRGLHNCWSFRREGKQEMKIC